jgi:hypothetical protein
MVILTEIKTSLGILEDNLGFDSELLMFINSAASSLVQLGVAEMNTPIEVETEWPDFPNEQVEHLAKHFISLKVRQTFDPVASETISNTFSSSLMELEGRIAHEMAEVVDAG